MIDILEMVDALFEDKCIECYNNLAGYTRAFRDVCRENGRSDEEIKSKIEKITKRAIKLISVVTEEVEREKCDGE